MTDHTGSIPEWQPIATAPQDGTVIQVWSPTHGTFAAWRLKKRKYGWKTKGGKNVPRPTHWLPLQEPE